MKLLKSSLVLFSVFAFTQINAQAPAQAEHKANKKVKIQERFAVIDANSDGLLSLDEYVSKPKHEGKKHKAKKAQLEPRPENGDIAKKKADPKKKFERMDKNKDGAVSLDEFAKSKRKKHKKRKKRKMKNTETITE